MARSISLLGALVVMMVLTRILDESAYGQYQKIWLLFTLLSPGFVNTAVQTLYYRGGATEHKSGAVWAMFGLLSIAAVLISLIAFFGASFWASTFNSPELATVFQYFAIYIFLATIAGIAEPIFILIDRKKWLLGYNIVYNSVDAALIIIPFLLGYSLETVVLFMIAGPALRLFFILSLSARHTGKLDYENFSSEMSLSAQYAKGILMVSFLGLLIFEADKVIVSIFMADDADFATYVVGAKKIPFMMALVASVASAFIVQYAKQLTDRKFAEVTPAIAHTTNRLFLLILPAILFGFLYSEEILVLLFEKYAHSAPIFQIYILSMVLNLFISDTVILGTGESKVYARISAIELLLNIILSIALIFPLGLLGPAVATFIARFVNVMLCHLHCKVKYDISMRTFFPGRPASMLLISLPVIAGMAYLLSFANWHAYISMGITGAVMVFLTLWQNRKIGMKG